MQFNLEQIPPGTHETRWIDVCRLDDQSMLRLPLLVVQGARPGRTLVALGGVHGDEYEGVDAVHQVFESLDPNEMSGAFLGAPVCNPPAFAAQTRTSPIDGMNLATRLPGPRRRLGQRAGSPM